MRVRPIIDIMKKLQLRECYMCFCAKRSADYGFGGICSKQKLPRKKKKQLKQFLILMGNHQFRYFMDHPTSCDLADEYNRQKKFFHLVPLLTNRAGALSKIWEYSDNADERIYFDEKGCLAWYWESDDDFTGGSSCHFVTRRKQQAKPGRLMK
jgi:hypothetical protein